MANWLGFPSTGAMVRSAFPIHDVLTRSEPPNLYPCSTDPDIAPLPSAFAMTLPDLPICQSDQRACGYRNTSDRMVIVRCIGPEEFFLERVVFPFELLSFECPPATDVQIWTHGLGGPELIETLQADELLIEAAPAPAMPLPLPLEELNPWVRAS